MDKDRYGNAVGNHSSYPDGQYINKKGDHHGRHLAQLGITADIVFLSLFGIQLRRFLCQITFIRPILLYMGKLASCAILDSIFLLVQQRLSLASVAYFDWK